MDYAMYAADRPRYAWLNEQSRDFMNTDYLVDGQTPEGRVRQIGETAEGIQKVKGLADKIEDYASRGWYSFSTPVWTNFGMNRGLPISCYGSRMADSMIAIMKTHLEIGIMSKNGGGTSVYMGDLRGRGSPIRGGRNGTSAGSVNFAELFDKEIQVVSQGSARRGECAAYWPITHPDFPEALKIRRKGHPIQKLSYGVSIPDGWMREMVGGDIAKRELWAQVLNSRVETGYPYLFFVDAANRGAPKEYAEHGLAITHSNLCSEIALANTFEESFVCCLSSMNDLYFDEWEHTDAIEVIVYLLDAVMTEFIEKASTEEGMERAVRFAERQRALGLGQLGWHSHLQSKMIPFESVEAKRANARIAKTIRDQSHAASRKLAAQYGEPFYLKGKGRRNMTLTAIAPTKSSSTILGQMSEGVEPFTTNYTVKDNQKGKISLKNPILARLMDQKGINRPDVWMEILKHGGSVQRLPYFTDHEKSVFKTFAEISPMEIVTQAAQRQQFVDQGQSINLMIGPNVSPKDVNKLYVAAWELGMKSLYYQKSTNAAQSFAREITTCSACES